MLVWQEEEVVSYTSCRLFRGGQVQAGVITRHVSGGGGRTATVCEDWPSSYHRGLCPQLRAAETTLPAAFVTS